MDISQKKLKGFFWRSDFYGAVTEGGMATMHLGLLNGFQELGCNCSFASSGFMQLPDRVSYYYIPYNNFLRNLPEVLNLPYNSRSKKALLKIIDHEQPDFLYQHHADFIYSGSLLKKELGIPFFLQCEAVQQWSKRYWGKHYLRKFLKWAEEIQWENADAIFVVSNNVKKMMIDYGVEAEKVYVHKSSVNTSMFHPGIDSSVIREKYSLNGKFVCGFSGTFAQWHGIEIFAHAIKYVVKKIPNFVALFVGDGILRPRIEQIIKNDNVGEYSIITGLVPFKDMPKYLAACDLLVSPCVNNPDNSLFFNSPIKLYEYLAMGKPIIASNVGEQGESINHLYNGILCDPDSPEILAENIIWLFDEPDLRMKLSQQARTDAVEKHQWINNARGVLKVYENLIS